MNRRMVEKCSEKDLKENEGKEKRNATSPPRRETPKYTLSAVLQHAGSLFICTLFCRWSATQWTDNHWQVVSSGAWPPDDEDDDTETKWLRRPISPPGVATTWQNLIIARIGRNSMLRWDWPNALNLNDSRGYFDDCSEVSVFAHSYERIVCRVAGGVNNILLTDS